MHEHEILFDFSSFVDNTKRGGKSLQLLNYCTTHGVLYGLLLKNLTTIYYKELSFLLQTDPIKEKDQNKLFVVKKH